MFKLSVKGPNNQGQIHRNFSFFVSTLLDNAGIKDGEFALTLVAPKSSEHMSGNGIKYKGVRRYSILLVIQADGPEHRMLGYLLGHRQNVLAVDAAIRKFLGEKKFFDPSAVESAGNGEVSILPVSPVPSKPLEEGQGLQPSALQCGLGDQFSASFGKALNPSEQTRKPRSPLLHFTKTETGITLLLQAVLEFARVNNPSGSSAASLVIPPHGLGKTLATTLGGATFSPKAGGPLVQFLRKNGYFTEGSGPRYTFSSKALDMLRVSGSPTSPLVKEIVPLTTASVPVVESKRVTESPSLDLSGFDPQAFAQQMTLMASALRKYTQALAELPNVITAIEGAKEGVRKQEDALTHANQHVALLEERRSALSAVLTTPGLKAMHEVFEGLKSALP